MSIMSPAWKERASLWYGLGTQETIARACPSIGMFGSRGEHCCDWLDDDGDDCPETSVSGVWLFASDKMYPRNLSADLLLIIFIFLFTYSSLPRMRSARFAAGLRRSWKLIKYINNLSTLQKKYCEGIQAHDTSFLPANVNMKLVDEWVSQCWWWMGVKQDMCMICSLHTVYRNCSGLQSLCTKFIYHRRPYPRPVSQYTNSEQNRHKFCF